jgi:hypothetical protein
MSTFEDPFIITATPQLCDDGECAPCTGSVPPEECLVCGYPSEAFETCASETTPCLSGSVECLDCESAFANFDINFLGGLVSGFSSRLGFGASESTVNIDIVIPKYKCPEVTIPAENGVCCEPDQSCSTLYSGQEDCENAGGTWIAGSTCDDNPCECYECGEESKYEGKLAYIYTFNMGAFCFRGILTNHNYSEDNSGYRYRITLTDGRSILNNSVVLLNGTYASLPPEFSSNAISVGGNQENSVANNDCGNGNQCKDFMITSSGSSRGIKVKSALQSINDRCISIPVSNAGLRLNVTKLINVVSDEIRTTNTESSILELITLAAEESGYDFIISINNNNEFEVLPVNYKRPATSKSLFSFIEDLTAKDIVISKEYGEEMSGSSSKNKRIVFGNNISYLTSVRDYPAQLYCDPVIPTYNDGICCDPGESCSLNTYANKEDCENAGGLWYYNTSCDFEACEDQPVCTIKNGPASIGAYDTFYITPTPYPEDEGC